MAGVSAAMLGVVVPVAVSNVAVSNVGKATPALRQNKAALGGKQGRGLGFAFTPLRLRANNNNNINHGKSYVRSTVAAAAAQEHQTAVPSSQWPGVLPEVRGRVALLLPDPSIAASDYALLWTEQDRRDFRAVADAVANVPGIEVVELTNHATLVRELLDNPPTLAFNCLQEGWKNRESMEMHVPALLDALDVPYTGSGPDSIVITQNKGLAHHALSQVGVPVPFEIYIAPDEDIEAAIPRGGIPYPAFAKYGNASNSLGISEANIATDRHAAIAVLKQLREREPTRPLLLQEYLTGREVTVAFIGNESTGNFRMLPPLELDYSALDGSWGPLQLERVKNRPDLSFWQQTKEVQAAMSAEEMAELEDIVKRIVARCSLRDYARIDFRADNTGRLKVMDVNANCWLGGKFRTMAEWGGLSWEQALDVIARSALARTNLARSTQKREDAKKLAELAAKRRLAMSAIVEEREKHEHAAKKAEQVAMRRVALSALYEARKTGKDVTDLPISLDGKPTTTQQPQEQQEEENVGVTIEQNRERHADDAELVAARRIAMTKVILEMRQQAARQQATSEAK